MLEELKRQVCEANLELVARGVVILKPMASMKQYVLDKHYMRKHGPNAYYGQK